MVTVSISGVKAPPDKAPNQFVQLGAVTLGQEGSLMRGPSFSRTSSIRWLTLYDWRYWDETKVASEGSSFEVVQISRRESLT